MVSATFSKEWSSVSSGSDDLSSTGSFNAKSSSGILLGSTAFAELIIEAISSSVKAFSLSWGKSSWTPPLSMFIISSSAPESYWAFDALNLCSRSSKAFASSAWDSKDSTFSAGESFSLLLRASSFASVATSACSIVSSKLSDRLSSFWGVSSTVSEAVVELGSLPLPTISKSSSGTAQDTTPFSSLLLSSCGSGLKIACSDLSWISPISLVSSFSLLATSVVSAVSSSADVTVASSTGVSSKESSCSGTSNSGSTASLSR